MQLGAQIGHHVRVLLFSIISPLAPWVEAQRLATIKVDDFASGFALFTTLEFLYDWLHCASHRVRWFWGSYAVHHAPNQLNLGASLRIGSIDRLFGTCIPERDDLPCRYGLVHPMNSDNPLKAEFAQWTSLARDLAGAPAPGSGRDRRPGT